MLKFLKAGKIVLISGTLVALSTGLVAASPLGKQILQRTKESASKIIKEPATTPQPSPASATPSLAPKVTPTSVARSAPVGMTLVALHKGTQVYCYSDHLTEIKEADQALRNNSAAVTQCYKEANASSDAAQRYQASLKCNNLTDNSIVQTWTSLKRQYCIDKFFYDKYGWPADFPRR